MCRCGRRSSCLPAKPAGAAPRLLVTAGSNGALVFNETMPKIVARLLSEVPGLTIVHQSGPRRLEETRAEYSRERSGCGAVVGGGVPEGHAGAVCGGGCGAGAVGEYDGGAVCRGQGVGAGAVADGGG